MTRRDRSFVVYAWTKGTHSHTLLHPPLRVFLEEGGGGFPSRMLTRWVSVKDESLCARCRRKTMPLPREALKTPNTPLTEILWFLGFSLGIGSGAGAGSSSSFPLSFLAVSGR